MIITAETILWLWNDIFIFKSIYNNIYMYIKSIITRTVCGLACCVFPCLNLQAQEVVAYNDLTDLNLNITVNYGDQNLISHLIDNSLTTVYTLDKFDGAWSIDFYSPVPLVVTGVNLEC